MKKYILIFGLLLSVLLTGCQSEEYTAANADSSVISDNNGEESVVSNNDQPEQSTDSDSSVISDNNGEESIVSDNDQPEQSTDADSSVISDNTGEESVVSNDDQSKPSMGFQAYDEQISKYADRLPAEYGEGIPDKMIYGVMTDMNKLMITHMTYYNTTEEKMDIYIDVKGERHICLEHLLTYDAEIVFEDGLPASADDLKPGTPVLVESDYTLESNPAQRHCTKIVILKQ